MSDRQSYLDWQQAEHEVEAMNWAYTAAQREGGATEAQRAELTRLRDVASQLLRVMVADMKTPINGQNLRQPATPPAVAARNA